MHLSLGCVQLTRTSVNAFGVKTPALSQTYTVKPCLSVCVVCLCSTESVNLHQIYIWIRPHKHIDNTHTVDWCSLDQFLNAMHWIQTVAVEQILNKPLHRGSSKLIQMWPCFTSRCAKLCPSSPVVACACFIISPHVFVIPPPPSFFHLHTHHFINHFHCFLFLHLHPPWLPSPPPNRQQWRAVLLPDHALSQQHPAHHRPWAGCLGGVQGNAVNANEAGTGLLRGRLDGWEWHCQPLTPSTGLEGKLSDQHRPLKCLLLSCSKDCW